MRALRTFGMLGIVAGTTVLGLVASTGAALAAGPVKVNAYNQLRIETFGQGTFGAWRTVPQDSPLDANGKALVVTVATDPDTSDSNYYYADAYTRASLHINKAVGNVKNLSFDFQSNQTTGGVPRISLVFGNGDIGYMAADRCAQPLAISGGTWSRADWTGANLSNAALCHFDVTGTTGGDYMSTSTQSAWQVYVAANPAQVLVQDYLVWDEPGTWTIDRVSLGTGFQFNNDNTHGIKCTTEASC